MNCGPIGDRQKLFDTSPASLAFNLRIPFTERVGHDTAHTLPSHMDDA